MHSNIGARDLAKLPRVPFDDTLMTIMLLNDQPIIAMTTEDSPERFGLERPGYCHIVRIDRRWSEN